MLHRETLSQKTKTALQANLMHSEAGEPLAPPLCGVGMSVVWGIALCCWLVIAVTFGPRASVEPAALRRGEETPRLQSL